MLAQNFKTAAELGIPEVIHEGLIKVLGMMERGELRHVDITNLVEEEYDIKPELSGNFNMGIWCQPYENCGTVCCIGGAVEILCGAAFNHDSPNLYNLFHPGGAWFYEDITVGQAACATRNYLATGNADWDSILGT